MRISAVLLIFLMLLIPSLGFSHGGTLNSQGCHNDRKMGGNHCHRITPTNTYRENNLVPQVIDGDTIEVVQNGRPERVRLTEIDAPEMSQPGGPASKSQLQALINGKEIRLVGSGRDRYQRVLAEIYVGKTNINKQMVSLGHAWAYTRYQTDPIYTSLESSARRLRKGLWASENPVPPWDWRNWRSSNRNSNTNDSGKDRPRCGSKRYCREMSSCAEARHYLSQCGLTRLDGDRDGVPCESICR